MIIYKEINAKYIKEAVKHIEKLTRILAEEVSSWIKEWKMLRCKCF